jgi:hypothetical protein
MGFMKAALGVRADFVALFAPADFVAPLAGAFLAAAFAGADFLAVVLALPADFFEVAIACLS